MPNNLKQFIPSDQDITQILLDGGFKLKEQENGEMALNQYVLPAVKVAIYSGLINMQLAILEQAYDLSKPRVKAFVDLVLTEQYDKEYWIGITNLNAGLLLIHRINDDVYVRITGGTSVEIINGDTVDTRYDDWHVKYYSSMSDEQKDAYGVDNSVYDLLMKLEEIRLSYNKDMVGDEEC